MKFHNPKWLVLDVDKITSLEDIKIILNVLKIAIEGSQITDDNRHLFKEIE